MAKMYGRNGKKARRFSGRAKRHVRGHVGGRGNIRAQGRAKTRHYQYQGQAITVNQNPGGRSGSWVVGGVPNPGDPEVFRDPGNNWVIPIDYSLPPNDPECFVAGTKVTMKNGPDKNIEDIKVGDEILSYNVNTKQLEPKTVTKLFTQTHDLKDGDITVKVTFDNGTITHNTIANPFWSKDKGFVAVDEDRCNRVHAWVQETNSGNAVKSLDVNDTLFTLNDDSGELEEVKVSDIEYIMEEDIRTYDIQVEDNHTFFANGILTHNSGDEEDDDDGSSCFHPDSIVTLENGITKKVSEVNFGDKVQAIDDNGNVIYSEVVQDLFNNTKNNTSKFYYTVIKAGGEILRVTSRHRIFVNGVNKTMKARYIYPTMKINIVKDGVLKSVEVESIEHTLLTGKYDLFTEAGSVVVDGIVCTIFDGPLPHKFSLFMWKLVNKFRWAYKPLQRYIYSPIYKLTTHEIK